MSKRCSAKNRNGNQCGAWAVTGSTQCALHSNPELAAKMGSKHERMLAFPAQPVALDLPHKRLNNIGEVIELLGETITRVQQGPFHLRAANTIGFLTAILLKALDQRVEEPVGGYEPNGNELKAITSLPRTKVEGEVLEHELMRLVVGLNQNQFPKEKLEAIKAGIVLLDKSGRLIVKTPDNPEAGGSTGIYTNLFQRLALPDSTLTASEPPKAEEGVYDLYPQPQEVREAAPANITLPPPGESIDEPQSPPKPNSHIIAVEIE